MGNRRDPYEAVTPEFPMSAIEPPDWLTRREFLRLAGAGMALAGLSGCIVPPRERILPYSVRPLQVTPGVPRYYATTMSLGGWGTGLLVESREGRPTKVEGNPDHPASLGAAGVYEQASVLQLYDPYRARMPRLGINPISWESVVREFGPIPDRALPAPGGERLGGAPLNGAGLRFLLEPTAAPLTTELIAQIRERYPEARFHFYAPLSCNAPYDGARLAFGRPLQVHHDIAAAAVILSLDADFIGCTPFNLRHARQFADRRRLTSPADSMNRLYVVESALSDTGSVADHRLRMRACDVGLFALALLAELGLEGRTAIALPDVLRSAVQQFSTSVPATWVRAVARDLSAQQGRSLVIAGDAQPPAVHALTHALNALLGNIGRTVRYSPPLLLDAGEPTHGIEPLVTDMRAGAVDTLIILGGNPSYNAPANLEFSRALRAVKRSACLGLYENETARNCAWFIPELHYLESWADARAFDGTASLVQPLISPLYDGRSVDQVLAVFLGAAASSPYELLRESWQRRSGTADFDSFWDEALQRGVILNTAVTPQPAALQWAALPAMVAELAGNRPANAIEVVFRPDAKVYDGRFANNPWLQELPDPITKLTWDNAALLSPRTAAHLRVETGDMLSLAVQGRTLTIPALVAPAHADASVTLHFGYGRTGAESIARRIGWNAYAIWPAPDRYFTNAQVARAPAGQVQHVALAMTQTHWSMEGRPLVLESPLEAYRENPDFTRGQQGRALSLYQPFPYTGDQWGMTIDLGVCTGCSACVVACQAENNTPVVGKAGVLNSREMHWLRIDRYFTDSEEPGTVVQPMLCQHCEKAPCEYVCPVNATVHSPDGLNEMVYNRCVGTRFCSNNCPYKVRRFNWFNYNMSRSETEQMQLNPDVTVRARGVMEKCTYCVQRIRRAQIQAGIEDRPLRDGDVRTACQQACPTHAIVFGSLGDVESEVARTRQQPRTYSVLHNLGTEPRTKYLARITNPNPELEEG